MKTRGDISEIEITPQFFSERSAAFSIQGSTNYYKYVYALGREGDRESFEKGVLDGIREKAEVAHYTANFFDLDLDAPYVFYLIAYDRLSNQPTETMEYPFRTAAKGTVPAVEIQLEHIDIYSGDYRIIPNEHCRKFGVAATLGGEYDEVIENDNYKGNALEMLWSWERSRNGYVTVGYQELPYQFTTPGLMLGDEDAFNHPIDLFVMVYGEDEDPLSVQKFVFETPAYDDTLPEAGVSIRVTDIHDNGAMYEFILSGNAMGLVYETVDEEWYEQLLSSGSYYEGYMEDLIYQNGYWNYVHGVSRTSFPEVTAQPGRNYRVFYMVMNYNGPFGGWSKMQTYSYTTTGERSN
ncbi:MAG: hypothetical protein LUD68_04330 [Rikenellaceae bacterium]|nr:hypothetical protein [Rikenellaceae bacterium]